jgi:hypothetical protein
MGSSTCGLQLNGSAAAATPAKSDNPNNAVLMMKESSALIHITQRDFSGGFIGYFFLKLSRDDILEILSFSPAYVIGSTDSSDLTASVSSRNRRALERAVAA